MASAAVDVTDNLRILHVPIVFDDNLDVCGAALRDALARQLRHHVRPAPQALVIWGPFGSGKRLLMQRMLSLYPDKFALPTVYTSNPASKGGSFKLVGTAFIDDLRREGLLAYEESALGHTYAVAKADICRCDCTLQACALR
jgi:ribose 1,5-bisphosphokinase PhnN